MPSLPCVSVIIPTYNRVQLLKQAVISVLQQTYQNFEIIIINDGSTVNIFESVHNLDSRIKVIKQKHSGSGNARNLGIQYARGKYVAFLDDDDIFMPDK